MTSLSVSETGIVATNTRLGRVTASSAISDVLCQCFPRPLSESFMHILKANDALFGMEHRSTLTRTFEQISSCCRRRPRSRTRRRPVPVHVYTEVNLAVYVPCVCSNCAVDEPV